MSSSERCTCSQQKKKNPRSAFTAISSLARTVTEFKHPGDGDSEDRETSGSPSPPPQSVSIEQAIEEAPVAELRKLVQCLWKDVPQSRPLIDAALLRPLGESSEGGGGGGGGLKRKATEVCENCNQVYRVEDNKHGTCVYHPSKSHLLRGRHRRFGPVPFRSILFHSFRILTINYNSLTRDLLPPFCQWSKK